MNVFRGALATVFILGFANCGGERDFKDVSAAGQGGAAGTSGSGTGGAKGGAAGRGGSSAGSAGRAAGSAGDEGGMGGEANEAGGSGGPSSAAGGQGGEGASSGDGGRAGAGAGEGGDSGAPSPNDEAGAGGDGGSAGGAEPIPFACGDPLPPVTFPEVFTGTGTPPVPEGGKITEGVYVLKQVVIYGTYSSVPGDVFELRQGQLHHQHTTYSSSGSGLTGYEQVGTYATTGAAMAVYVDACGVGSGPGLWRFTADGDEIRLFTTQSSTTWVQTFELER